MMKKIFSFIIKIILTPFLVFVAVLILLIYILIGLIIVPAQSIRYLSLTIIAAMRSAFDNKDYTNTFIDMLFDFYDKYIQFFSQIFFIPMAIWVPANENPSKLKETLELEWKLISENWIRTILIFSSLIFSVSLSTVIIGVKGFDLLNIENKIYNPNKNLLLIENYYKSEKSIKKDYKNKIEKLKIRHHSQIDSINNSYKEKKKRAIFRNTSKAYLLSYYDKISDTLVKNSMEKMEKIIRWKKSDDLPNTYFIISKSSAYEISDEFNVKTDSIGHVLIEFQKYNYQGWMKTKYWNFIHMKDE